MADYARLIVNIFIFFILFSQESYLYGIQKGKVYNDHLL